MFADCILTLKTFWVTTVRHQYTILCNVYLTDNADANISVERTCTLYHRSPACNIKMMANIRSA